MQIPVGTRRSVCIRRVVSCAHTYTGFCVHETGANAPRVPSGIRGGRYYYIIV